MSSFLWMTVSNGIWPLAVNLGWVLFIYFTYDGDIPVFSNQNILWFISVCCFALSGIPICLTYYFAASVWIYEFPQNPVCTIISSILYPITFLVTLPMTLFHFCKRWFCIVPLWNICCCEECSRDGIHVVHRRGINCLSCECCWISIPFALFSLIYIVGVVIIAPFVFILLFPLGIGALGVALHAALRVGIASNDHVTIAITDSNYKNCVAFGFFSCFPAVLLACIYMAMKSIFWAPLYLLVVSGLYLLTVFIHSVIQVCTEPRDTIVENPYQNNDGIHRMRVHPEFPQLSYHV